MKRVTVLGSTGSIGTSTLDVLRRHPSRFTVHALTAYSNIARLEEQIREFRPDYAVVVDPDAHLSLKARLDRTQSRTELLQGASALEYVASHPKTDYVMAAIVGAAGLLPTLAAAEAGKRVLLANKEALVIAGALFMETVRRHGAELLPIDSEHNAIFQCLPAPLASGKHSTKDVEKILLTASGGPFRQTPRDQLSRVSVEQACAHPNWRMGRKISIDSATLMNKGLEWIEACYLFDLTPDQVEIVIHPQSLIHSMVQYSDGSVLAQMGTPDMRIPIAYALGWPERLESGCAKLDLVKAARLDFEAPDHERFPCLRLAETAIRRGGNAPAVLNAANEVAVQAFLAGQIRFIDIAAVIQFVMDRLNPQPAATVEALLAEDRKARVLALDFIETNALEA